MESVLATVFQALIWNILLFALGSLLYYTYLVIYNRHKYAHLPSPKPVSFFFGHALVIRNEYKLKGFMFDLWSEWAEELGPVYVLYNLHKPWVVTWDPKAVKEVLVSNNFPKSESVYSQFAFVLGTRFVGYSIANETNVKNWSIRRHELNPAFQRCSLNKMIIEFNAIGDQLVQKLGDSADKHEPVKLYSVFHRVAIDVICKVAFGKDIDSVKNGDGLVCKSMLNIVEIFTESYRDPLMKIPFWGRSKKKKFKKLMTYMRNTGQKWIEERESAYRNGEYVPDDILSQMIKMKVKNIYENEEVMLDDLFTFFSAGHETTASTLALMFMELGRHPKILERVYEEVDEVIGQKPNITLEDINKLEYINLVWKETLRMYSIASILFRDVDRDGFKINGLHIPKNSTILVNTYVSARLPALVPNPLEFKPERFLSGSPDRPNTYGYCPFSMGPRNCIGQNFANLEGRVVVAKFLQHFSFILDPNESFALKEEGTLKPKDCVRATVSWRNFSKSVK